MARSDMLIDLVEAERSGDRARFTALVEAVIAEERQKHHHLVADRLSAILTSSGPTRPEVRRDSAGEAIRDLLHEVVPKRRLADLTLADPVVALVNELVEEHHRAELLRSHNLEPRHRVLLSGPPGNGKTSLAEVIAAEAMLPLYVARYEGLVSSFLGETAGRLDDAFEFARTRRCVLFFDEFDTIAKERSDEHETGEIKRVVSTLLMQIDQLPSHVIVVCATNHAELLDRAAWRRFQLRLAVEGPTRQARVKFLERIAARTGGELGLASRTLADKLKGASFAELEQFVLDVRRRFVLGLPDADLMAVTRDKVVQWQTQARS